MEIDLVDHFENFGPTHLVARAGSGSSRMLIDWNEEEHRRCITAGLVNGTYVIENDRVRRRRAELAPAWWKSFHFDKTYELHDERSIFGAVYKHVPPAPAGWSNNQQASAPDYIVAFRGTMPWHIQDMHLNFNIFTNTVHDSARSRHARKVVRDILATTQKRSVVWLTGHSQGASLALEVGRDVMVRDGRNLPTFLFNPPQVSLAPAINRMMHPSEAARRELYALSNLVKAGLGVVLRPHRKRMEKLFQQLSPWAPRLYVHDKDTICLGFIEYFEQREQLQERFHGAARSAMALSYRDMLFYLLGKDKEPRPHLLPSATLWKNSSNVDGYPHGLRQWWKPDGDLWLTKRVYTY